MYRFKPDLSLSHLINGEIVQISLAEYNLYIHLEPKNVIQIMGAWQLLDTKGHVVDEGDLQKEKEAYKIHKILGWRISKYNIEAETRLVFEFDNSWKLVMIDNSEHYETGFISPDIYV
jgi:hypothetical protein